MEDQRRLVTLGGKGSALSSSSVYEIANRLARLNMDSSALSKVSSSSSSSSNSKTSKTDAKTDAVTISAPFSILSNLTREESRASLVILLNKLLLSSSSTSTAVNQLSDLILNDVSPSEQDTIDGVSPGDFSVALIAGISTILDHRSSALSVISDAVAALSCEALQADISAFNLNDSGDGSSAKDVISVASDLKILLNGSKRVNSKSDEPAVASVPVVHGKFREICRLLHSGTRVQLNSAVVSNSGSSGTVSAMCTTLFSLAVALKDLGNISYNRAKHIVDYHIAKDIEFSANPQKEDSANLQKKDSANLQKEFSAKLQEECPRPDQLKALFASLVSAHSEEEYVKFSHDVNSLLVMVEQIISWEALAAFISLEGKDFIGGASVGEDTTKAVKKGGNKKIGKGTTALVQFLKDRLLSMPIQNVTVLENLVRNFLSLLEPKDLGFDTLLKKVKDIVDSNESRRLPKLPKGTRDFAKEQMAVREKAFSIIVEVFKRHGASALDTPAFEMRETLMGKYGEDSKLIYDLADQGGELCSLRYDLTVPFARYVAMNGLTSFKRYQIAKVYRRDNPSKGRYREFYQCDFDIAGQFEKMMPDFEVIKILTELLDELDIGEYEVKLNHRKLLDGMLAICGVPQEKFRTICSSIDKLDKQSFEQIKREMVDEKGLSNEISDRIGTFVKWRGPPVELLSKLKQERSFLENNESSLALDELEIMFKALEKSKCIDKVVFDLSLARGLDYYTGVIFEAVFKGAAQVGSIAAGGRYDNLIGMFGTRQVPAVGISLGIERVFAIMEQLQKDKNQEIRATETQVLVSILGDDSALAAELVGELWNAKVKAEFMIHKKVMKHIDRARDAKIPWMVLVGERELSEGVVKLKDVVAAIDYEVPRGKLVDDICRRLGM
ncbi:Histidine--tRNA ligase, cytoplasmic [Capsicum annuum]|uniref:Histidine--tRNA ligase, cytoplasmic n=1 Tax=Capsicum annuum TaxID=4072 RepID=A0A1U8DV83_CAPAN|nr:histidine--tRNA ligase, cytoplasmic [Capsicum annuum]KAF3677521.1 Histidine--tRNA ligase, cytoplasmic [Capsicum annuum]PHT62195.1 Histidine--tRNA ligase, cytoplasmic [Capsicum annuum]